MSPSLLGTNSRNSSTPHKIMSALKVIDFIKGTHLSCQNTHLSTPHKIMSALKLGTT